MNQAFPRAGSGVSRRLKAATVVILAVMLSGCELILAEPTPRAGDACPAWRGGCAATFDLKGDGASPRLQSEILIAGNISTANRMQVPACDTAPWICQLQGSADVLAERYFGSPSSR